MECPECGYILCLDNTNSRQEWVRYYYYCRICDKEFTRITRFKTQSHLVESDEWENLPKNDKTKDYKNKVLLSNINKKFVYKKPGKYYAICNNTNFDGHYVKEFELPDYDVSVKHQPDAAWYFLNRVDGVACLEAVYPVELFDKLTVQLFQVIIKSMQNERIALEEKVKKLREIINVAIERLREGDNYA